MFNGIPQSQLTIGIPKTNQYSERKKIKNLDRKDNLVNLLLVVVKVSNRLNIRLKTP